MLKKCWPSSELSVRKCCWKPCSMQGCHKPSVYKNGISAKCRKSEPNKMRYAEHFCNWSLNLSQTQFIICRSNPLLLLHGPCFVIKSSQFCLKSNFKQLDCFLSLVPNALLFASYCIDINCCVSFTCTCFFRLSGHYHGSKYHLVCPSDGIAGLPNPEGCK